MSRRCFQDGTNAHVILNTAYLFCSTIIAWLRVLSADGEGCSHNSDRGFVWSRKVVLVRQLQNIQLLVVPWNVLQLYPIFGCASRSPEAVRSRSDFLCTEDSRTLCSLSCSTININELRREYDAVVETTRSRGSEECLTFCHDFGRLCGTACQS